MIFTKPTEYAIRGLAELARRGDGHSIHLKKLFAGTDLPRGFMAKIFQRLVHADILFSAKGRDGGFELARPASQITIRSIIEAIDPPRRLEGCVLGMGRCRGETPCVLHTSYKPVDDALKQWLEKTTLADFAAAPLDEGAPAPRYRVRRDADARQRRGPVARTRRASAAAARAARDRAATEPL